ncbi:hypothetical protein B7494_g3033 [Chlorociboria aeruginascens]|nr:hypothetical protein B7494_g3033 [Chlorociboria aeruginascens]
MGSLSLDGFQATKEYAQALDKEDHLRSFREKFIIPTKATLKSKKLKPHSTHNKADDSIYFCGNSLGLQPKCTAELIQSQLDTWSSIAVNGHFTDLEESPLVQWQYMAEKTAAMSSDIIGASASEIAIMGSLTSNLHMLMASFYQPTPTKHKIILEWKAFPSDHLRWHGLNPEESMILVGPDDGTYNISTEKIFAIIDEHAAETALLFLPGIQYYSGQFFEIEKITAYAHSKGLVVGWDLAHAAGNVPLKLHDWDVDFAAWCTYKYINGGPGSIGGLFVHEKHGKVVYKFRPLPGAGGFQQSNPSIIDICSLMGGLKIFNETSMADIRKKSLKITAYLEFLLRELDSPAFRMISPTDPEQRGSQLCLLFQPDLLETIFARLEDDGIIVDRRKPDVMRVAPVPLYNSYVDVWNFVEALKKALKD